MKMVPKAQIRWHGTGSKKTPYIYLPPGTYHLTKPITMPNSSNIQTWNGKFPRKTSNIEAAKIAIIEAPKKKESLKKSNLAKAKNALKATPIHSTPSRSSSNSYGGQILTPSRHGKLTGITYSKASSAYDKAVDERKVAMEKDYEAKYQKYAEQYNIRPVSKMQIIIDEAIRSGIDPKVILDAQKAADEVTRQKRREAIERYQSNKSPNSNPNLDVFKGRFGGMI